MSRGGVSATQQGGANNAGGADSAIPVEMPLAKLPMGRQEHAVVAAAGEIYVIGGYAPTNVTDSVLAFDPVKNSWREVARFPERLNHANAGVINDVIYVAGYYVASSSTNASANVYAYTPSNDTWAPKRSMPTGRAAACTAVSGEWLYVFGGARGGSSVNNAARYNATNDQWEELPALPDRREHCAAGAIAGKLYVAGGRADTISGLQAQTWSFDPGTNRWSSTGTLPTPRGGVAGAVLDGRLFVSAEKAIATHPAAYFPTSKSTILATTFGALCPQCSCHATASPPLPSDPPFTFPAERPNKASEQPTNTACIRSTSDSANLANASIPSDSANLNAAAGAKLSAPKHAGEGSTIESNFRRRAGPGLRVNQDGRGTRRRRGQTPSEMRSSSSWSNVSSIPPFSPEAIAASRASFEG